MDQRVQDLIEQMANLPATKETYDERHAIISTLRRKHGIEMHGYPDEPERWRRYQWRNDNGFVAYVGPEGSARAESLEERYQEK